MLNRADRSKYVCALRLTGCLTAIALAAGPSEATIRQATSYLTGVEQNSFNRGGSPDASDFTFIRFNAAMVPAPPPTGCTVNIAYFNGKSNPHLLAVALTALASGHTVNVVIDDSFPTYSTICQIIDLRINADM